MHTPCLSCIEWLLFRKDARMLTIPMRPPDFPVGTKIIVTRGMIFLCIDHYHDVIMTTIACQITSLAVVYSTVYSDVDQRKHQSSASLAFVWGNHRDRWIPRTKGQLRGKCFHLMTSPCDAQKASTSTQLCIFVCIFVCTYVFIVKN